MAPPTGCRPQTSSFAAALKEQMARRQAAAVKTSRSPTPALIKKTTIETEQQHIAIDLTADDEDDDTPIAPQPKKPRLISPQSPIEECPFTPQHHFLYSPLESPTTPSRMAPSLLQTALNAASPRSTVDPPQSPIEEINTRKRKLEISPYFLQKKARVESPRSPIEEVDAPAPDAKAQVQSPRSPIEQANAEAATAHASIEVSPSSAHAINTGAMPVRARVESPQIPVEEVAPPAHRAETANTSIARPNSATKEQSNIRTTEVSDRFAPVTIDGVEHRNPKHFSLEPPFWRRWESKTYIKFAEYLRRHFDPVPFAQETGLAVEEITHVFHAAVCNPLYWPKEAAARGEEGMKEVMKLFQAEKYATPKRPWGQGGEGGKQWLGEISGVTRGKVEIVLKNGNVKVMQLEELGGPDLKYLQDSLREED